MLKTLTARIFVLTAAVTLASVGIMAWQLLRMHGRHLEQQTVQGALRLSDTLRRSTRYSMMHNRKEDVYEIVSTVGAQPGIERIRIYSKDGEVRWSTDASERGAHVDTNAEACTRCHQGDGPVTVLEGRELTRIFRANGKRVLGLITPVHNEPDCAGAGCHARVSDQKILGVLDVQMSLADVDEAVADQDGRFIALTAAMMLVIASTCGAFLWYFVHLPTRALIRGTEQLARGNLSYRLPEGSETELGRLSVAFNQMAGDLALAREQITLWARTLEDRVNEKTRTLRQAQEKLVESERLASLGSLAAAVAHEINNPLTGVLTYARLLDKILRRNAPLTDRDAELFRYLEAVQTEVARCGKIVRNLLDFARGSDLTREKTDVTRVLDRALMLLDHRMTLQGVRLERTDGDISEIICDPDQVQQAILAVLVNAIEAMEDGGVLTVATRPEPTPVESVAIEIGDTGPGIPADVRSRLFEPFFTTKSERKGVGLGLSVVYGIVKRHDGDIRIESEPGRGAVFTLVFPRVPTELTDDALPEANEQEPADRNSGEVIK